VPADCVSVFPLPLATNVTLAPDTGAPLPSRTVTVMVARPVTAWIEVGSAVTVDWLALGPVPPPPPPPPPLLPLAMNPTTPTPDTTAFSVLVPLEGPSVQRADAKPSASVWLVPGRQRRRWSRSR
jgi:hypothetical protein